MMKVFSFLLIFVIIIFFVFGLLILFEYLKYWKRLFVLKLRFKSNNIEDIYSSSEFFEDTTND